MYLSAVTIIKPAIYQSRAGWESKLHSPLMHKGGLVSDTVHFSASVKSTGYNKCIYCAEPLENVRREIDIKDVMKSLKTRWERYKLPPHASEKAILRRDAELNADLDNFGDMIRNRELVYELYGKMDGIYQRYAGTAQLDDELEELGKVMAQRAIVSRSKEHIKAQAWGGTWNNDNIFPDACSKCNGSKRGFIPFLDFANGYGGDMVEQDGEVVFKRSDLPVTEEPELSERQRSLALFFSYLIIKDVRVPIRGIVQHSKFVAALPYMLHRPNDPPNLNPQEIGERMAYLFNPVMSKMPKFFSNPDVEMYLQVNRTFYEPYVDALIEKVIHPLQEQYHPKLELPRKGKRARHPDQGGQFVMTA